MESKTPGYRALPYIFSVVLILVGYLLNNWRILARETVSTEFDPTVYFVFMVIAPLLFALVSLLLFATVFNQRLTPTGSIILIVIGLLISLMPLSWWLPGLEGFVSLFLPTPYLPLSGAIVAVCGFAGLILKPKTEEPAALPHP